jgi:hypothetical protein
MESNFSSTRARLAEITDEGKFESLAAAVLRQAEPSYRHLIETGTNAEGKPIASPVDGLMSVPHSSPPHLICFHHTTTAQKRLREKWLEHGEGDLPKTARWAATRREKLPEAQVTLVLTTNRRVPPDLYVDVHADAAAHNLGLDIWDQSRIADHGVRLDDRQRIANFREQPIETNEYHSVDGAEGEFLWSTSPQNLICCRNVQISASSITRDRIRSTTIQPMSLQRSLIAHDHRPILDRLPSRIRFATGTRSRGAVTRDLAKPTEETAGRAGRHEPTSPNFAQLRASSRLEESRALQSVDD